MIIVSLFMLLVPGLISIRIHWKKNNIIPENYKYIVCDYLLYSFFIMVLDYTLIFIRDNNKIVSFSLFLLEAQTGSNIYAASFVCKYSFVAVLLAIILPSALKYRKTIFRGLSVVLAKLFEPVDGKNQRSNDSEE